MNNSSLIIPDLAARNEALDVTRSFIVQAPAGSGKTELLTQRYLTLLANACQHPEEILAITFTRKAAGEMRARVLAALQPENRDTLNPTSQKLAALVTEKNHTLNWNLLENPNRLRIQTIDSLCAYIANRLPILARFGVIPDITDDAEYLYITAARNVLTQLAKPAVISKPLETLLLYLDNDFVKAERLLKNMLAMRDQWLPYLYDNNPRPKLEAALQQLVSNHLMQVEKLFSATELAELITLYNYAQHQLKHPERFEKPSCRADDLKSWQALARFLLTKQNTWRKQFTVKEGFFSPSQAKNAAEKTHYTEMKARALAFVQTLSENESILANLITLLELPFPHYEDSEWQLVEALIDLLKYLVAELNVLFGEQQLVDHIEVSLRANFALGTNDAPTDLALSLDYQIKHILVDEFQDTSITQFRLIEKLMAGWQLNDGRTLFLVGDPMQSIYRFRKAEVGLFLQAKATGIGHMPLTPLTLTANFRSDERIIQWINQTFHPIFPAKNDLRASAIAYSPSQPIRSAQEHNAQIVIHSLFENQGKSEHETIIDIIKTQQQQHPQQSLALLVIARRHLLDILPALKQANIPFRAVEIETLNERPVVQDLFALTRALLNLQDKIAWFAVLRAPWCGLTLSDLTIIADHAENKTIYETLITYDMLPLSEDGQLRLQRVFPYLQNNYHERNRERLSRFIERTWIQIGGPATLAQLSDLEDAQAFFQLLDQVAIAHDIADLALLERAVERLSVSSHPEESNCIEVMTIHKAKGLEFDTVILPSLNRGTRGDDHQLLIWQEIPNENGDFDLLLAPINTHDQNHIYSYLRGLENTKASNEQARLFYVACTRAKYHLHLIATFQQNSEKPHHINEPTSGSMLNTIWPSLAQQFIAALPVHIDKQEINDTSITMNQRMLRRLCSDWSHPLQPKVHLPTNMDDKKNRALLEKIDLYSAKSQIGTIIHRLLKQLCDEPKIRDHFAEWLNEQWLRDQLRILGAPEQEIASAIKIIQAAIYNTLQDTQGRWILDNNHEQSRTEYEISVLLNETVQHKIVDRTFMSDGIRWIIDYKTSVPEDESLAIFLRQEKSRHREQLETYAQAFQLHENKPIRLGLYFPLISAWTEWEF